MKNESMSDEIDNRKTNSKNNKNKKIIKISFMKICHYIYHYIKNKNKIILSI